MAIIDDALCPKVLASAVHLLPTLLFVNCNFHVLIQVDGLGSHIPYVFYDVVSALLAILDPLELLARKQTNNRVKV